MLEEVAAAVNGELLKEGKVCCGTLVAPPGGRPAVLCADWVELEDVALRTDAKGLPANCRRSSEALSEGGAAEGTGAVAAAGPDTPKRSKMLGVPLSDAAGSGAAAKGLVAFEFSWNTDPS